MYLILLPDLLYEFAGVHLAIHTRTGIIWHFLTCLNLIIFPPKRIRCEGGRIKRTFLLVGIIGSKSMTPDNHRECLKATDG